MNLFARIAVIWLLLLVLFSWGFVAARYQVFPGKYIVPIVEELEGFAKGDVHEETSLKDKLVSELSGAPNRYLFDFKSKLPVEGIEPKTFSPRSLFSDAYEKLPELYTTRTEGYYLTYGVYGLKGEAFLPVALLINMDGEVKRHWSFPFEGSNRGPRNLSLTDDGILVTNASDRLRAQDWCGNKLWDLDDHSYHHEIDVNSEGLMVWGDKEIVVVNPKTGEHKSVINMDKIAAANPDAAVLKKGVKANGIKFEVNPDGMLILDSSDASGDNNARALSNYKLHHNKAASNDGVSKQFPHDAILISYRNIDLVAVVDRHSGKILWHALFDTQHDPDWLEDGVLVYNNGTYSGTTTIEKVSFSGEKTVLVGGGVGWSWHRGATGNQQLQADGSLMFQELKGIAAEVDEAGEVQTAIINWYNPQKVTMNRNVYYLSEEQVGVFGSTCSR